MENISLPDSLKSIGLWVFSNCTSLTSIFIPKGVEKIDNGAFTGWTEEQEINCEVSSEPMGWADRWCYYNSSADVGPKAKISWGATRPTTDIK